MMWIGKERKKRRDEKNSAKRSGNSFLLFLSDGKRQIRDEKEWKSHTDYWYLTIWYYLTFHFRQLKEKRNWQQWENWMKMKWKLLFIFSSLLRVVWLNWNTEKKSNAISPYITQNKIISCNLKQSIHSTTQHSRVYLSEKRRKVERYKLFAKQITGNTRNIFKGRKKSCWEWM